MRAYIYRVTNTRAARCGADTYTNKTWFWKVSTPINSIAKCERRSPLPYQSTLVIENSSKRYLYIQKESISYFPYMQKCIESNTAPLQDACILFFHAPFLSFSSLIRSCVATVLGCDCTVRVMFLFILQYYKYCHPDC